ncbi:hypothetical protein KSP40_PGU011284 [Platanthera guangdongensis]|uniref:Uncharacterized protein n=1 Tax=Platanthera guangdongensis TaxID=2320717 RepID=A0ABR2MSH6_9ASPA
MIRLAIGAPALKKFPPMSGRESLRLRQAPALEELSPISRRDRLRRALDKKALSSEFSPSGAQGPGTNKIYTISSFSGATDNPKKRLWTAVILKAVLERKYVEAYRNGASASCKLASKAPSRESFSEFKQDRSSVYEGTLFRSHEATEGFFYFVSSEREVSNSVKAAADEVEKKAATTREKIEGVTADKVIDKGAKATEKAVVTAQESGEKAKRSVQEAWNSAKETAEKVKETVREKAEDAKDSVIDSIEKAKRAVNDSSIH